MIESEKKLEKLLGKSIKEAGGWSLKMICTEVSGLPDRLCLLPGGRVIFAEVKTTKQRPTLLQKLVHKKLRELGFRVEVLDTSEKIKRLTTAC